MNSLSKALTYATLIAAFLPRANAEETITVPLADKDSCISRYEPLAEKRFQSSVCIPDLRKFIAENDYPKEMYFATSCSKNICERAFKPSENPQAKRYGTKDGSVTAEELYRPWAEASFTAFGSATANREDSISKEIKQLWKERGSVVDINGDGRISKKDDLNKDNRITREDQELSKASKRR